MGAGFVIRGLVAIFLTAILNENYVLSKFLGIGPFLGVSKKLNTAVGMSAAVNFVMILATAVTWPIFMLVLQPLGIEYLETVVFILIIAFLVQLVEIVLKKYMPPLYNSLGVYLPLITTNCAVLGVAMNVVTATLDDPASYGYIQALINSLGAGIGFLVAMVLFAGIRTKLETCNIPKTLRGLPITLVAASLLAVSFIAFSGVVNGMLGIS